MEKIDFFDTVNYSECTLQQKNMEKRKNSESLEKSIQTILSQTFKKPLHFGEVFYRVSITIWFHR